MMTRSSPSFIPLAPGQVAPVVYEDRAVLIIDKPSGWILAPCSWHRTSRNLQRVFESAIRANAPWARQRGLRFLRYVHRLDAATSGLLILVRNPTAVMRFSRLFETGQVRKLYLAVVVGAPPQDWTCRLRLSVSKRPEPRAQIDEVNGKEACTVFRVATSYRAKQQQRSILTAEPLTGRMHQIRAHLAACGCPVLGDTVYGSRRGARPSERQKPDSAMPLALRAVALGYKDPFTAKQVCVKAELHRFLRAFGAPAEASQRLEGVVEKWFTSLQDEPRFRKREVHPQDVHSPAPGTTC